LGNIEISRLANGSIRLALLTILNSCVFLWEKHGRGVVAFAPRHTSYSLSVMKGSTVRSIVRGVHPRVAQELANGMRMEMATGACCPYRMVLTYLHCRGEGEGVTLESLDSDLRRVFSYSDGTIARAVRDLYWSPATRADLVLVMQRPAIDQGESPAADAVVSITSRGREFVERIAIHIDYHLLVAKPGRDMGLFLTLPLDGAREAASEMLRSALSLEAKYRVYLDDVVYPRIANMIVGDSREWFREHMCIGRQFYLSRVVASHMGSIKRYAVEYLRGPESALARCYGVVAHSECLVDSDRPFVTDEELESHVETAGDAGLAALVEVYRQYRELLGQMESGWVGRLWDD
jgi:hypothetical protein